MKTKLKFLLTSILLLVVFVFAKPSLAAPPENFQVTQVIGSGLNGPSGFEIAPDGRIFILERTGKIKIFKDGSLLPTPFADLPSVASGDRGLIGIAFDPSFGVTNHYVYFYYTGTDLLNRLVRFDASTDVGTNGPFIIYQTNSPSQELHVGGSIQFGPDGKLYFAVGDNGYPPNAQNLGNPHGKILRINKDGSIPMDNPFVNQEGALGEIWAYGMRNPWRFQFDSVTGQMFGGDVGDYTWEEVNKIEKGKNYGWPVHEGNCNTNCSEYTNPIHTYNHDGLSSAVTGGPIYRGGLFPSEYYGNLFFGDYARGFIKRITLNDSGQATGVYNFDVNAGSVVDIKVANDGSIYYITYYPGRLYRIDYTTGNHSPIANATADNSKGVEPHTVNFSSSGSYDPDGDELNYLWNFGDGTQSISANPTKIYTNKGTYIVELTVSDSQSSSNAIPIVIQVGIPPTVNIGEPFADTTYQAGDLIHWTASALDGAGFDIDDRNISTEIILHHDTHIHPFIGPIIGRQGTFTVPNHGEASANTWFEIKVTATDTNGLYTTKSVFIYPEKSTMTFLSSVPGLKILIDGVPYITTHVVTGVVNFVREISATVVQELNGKYYQFVRWSDNGLVRHLISTPDVDATFTAFFDEVIPYTASYYDNPNLAGDPVLVRQESDINYLWGDTSPNDLIPNDNFSVKWEKRQYFAHGRYKFITATDDGVRLYVNNQLVINEWHGNSSSFSATVDLPAGEHDIRMEYFEGSGLANAKLYYELSTDTQPQNGYTAQYFQNKTLQGDPILIRNDNNIDFDWTYGSPDQTILPDNFSARWTKIEDFSSGIYTFTFTADDGARVYIDNQLVLDKWIDQPQTTFTFTQEINSGLHTIIVEYYENSGDAISKFDYQKTGELPTQNNYLAEYFENRFLQGQPLVSKYEENIDFNWGAISPDLTIPTDNFSGRFTKSIEFLAGTYEFTITADDGVRLYIDDELILDKWIDQAPTTYKVSKVLAQGNHNVKIEYYENGGDAVVKFGYAKVADTPTTTDSYVAEYFNNTNLLGTPVLVKNIDLIDFDWAGGSPDQLINANNFSIRFSKSKEFLAGTYEFTVTADDGVRVYVDNELILDKWIDQAPTTYIVSKELNAGTHSIVMEYYEFGGGAVAKLNMSHINPPVAGTYTGNYWNIANDGSMPTIPNLQPDFSENSSTINFDWTSTSPNAAIQLDRFVAVWTKTHNFDAGIYQFITESDDGVRVYVDNQLVIDQWNDHAKITHIAQKEMTAGSHVVKVEYYENFGDAVMKFNFNKMQSDTTNLFMAEYFNNISLAGSPIKTAHFENINFNWVLGSPDPTVNSNQFSVRFTKSRQFTAGLYTFTLRGDDGVRLYIDDQLVIDGWIDQAVTTYTYTANITEGMHNIRVEYYENYGDAILFFEQN